jgi:hypothetical protein
MFGYQKEQLFMDTPGKMMHIELSLKIKVYST